MSDFPSIKRCFPNVQVWAKPYTDNQMVVLAEELEAILQSAQVVYGSGFKSTDEVEWSTHQLKNDTMSGLIIGITPIKKKTKAEAALELLERLAKDPAYYSGLGTSAARAILEMKDEV